MEPAAFHRSLKARGTAAAILARRQWRKLGTVDDWQSIALPLWLIVTAAQQGAAQDAQALLDTTLGPEVKINPVAFGGYASDGRPLGSLLYSPVPYARSLYGSGKSDAEVMQAAEAWLAMHVQTQVSDAGRAATATGIAARDGAGWVRYVSPPCCQRCGTLAGRWYRYSQGFQRHPRCDCIHVPAMKGAALPAGYTPQIGTEDIHDLTEAQKAALAEGADLNRVVNAYRDAHRGQLLTEVKQAKGGRLTPDGIFSRAKDREEAVRLLRRYGYLL